MGVHLCKLCLYREEVCSPPSLFISGGWYCFSSEIHLPLNSVLWLFVLILMLLVVECGSLSLWFLNSQIDGELVKLFLEEFWWKWGLCVLAWRDAWLSNFQFQSFFSPEIQFESSFATGFSKEWEIKHSNHDRTMPTTSSHV